METKIALLQQLAKPLLHDLNKITIVGAGNVGTACAFTLLIKGISNNVVMIDAQPNKAKGEVMEFQHGSSHLNNARIVADNDYAVSKNSKVCIIAAGVKQKLGDSRLTLVQENAELMKLIVPNLIKYSPDTILLVASNPVDIISYICWKLSNLPVNKVIGTGTSLDTSRFKYFIGQKVDVPPTSIEAWVIGEHGDTSVPVWSSISIAGTRLMDLNPAIGTAEDPEDWQQLHKNVVTAAYDVIKLKSYTSWGIGLCTASIVENILKDTNRVEAVSTYVKCLHGVTQDIYLSVPAQIGANGITNIVVQNLTESERCAFKYSAATMSGFLETVKI